MLPFAFWEGLGVGLLVSTLGSVALWWLLRRRARGGPDLVVNARADGPRTSGTTPVLPPTSFSGPPERVALGSSILPAAPLVVAVAVDDGPVEAPLAPTNGGQLKISQRVVFHIAGHGRIHPDDVAPRGLTQAGMVEALAVNQGALTGVLRRLVAAGVLEERREHVRGADRRLKVYRLTSSGEELVREIRTRKPP